ncbi:uncharacterized protein RHO25_000025 [Cercospora beticola]|uniref:Zn(2)-C6 fungal-type domain-containing protein n=2 Tax=Cercospora beticola TaxID=122368 RepID=A0ABZ0N6D9_CERBT|nr:hypothetical protein RHO25_000025 [Cercospora beticola]
MSASNGDTEDGTGLDLEQSNCGHEALACEKCRKAKLRCSKERPCCSHCRRTQSQCTYATKRTKPGVKPGAIEAIHRRLEQRAKQQANTAHSPLTGEAFPDAYDGVPKRAYDVLSLLAQELPKLVNTAAEPSVAATQAIGSPSKKRKLSTENSAVAGPHNTPSNPCIQSSDAVIDTYFSHIHPWIPMIHQGRFSQGSSGATTREETCTLLDAMTVAAAKFVPGNKLTSESKTSLRKRIFENAIAHSSLAALQALIILAFDDLGSGNIDRAWQTLGFLTKTTIYMQISQEPDDQNRHPFCQPVRPLRPTDDFTTTEERRRIFWIAFLLERCCAVTTGWPTSTYADDIHRRLPCDGHLWRKEELVVTPYFGTWDKCRSTLELSTIGALAYNIEATDSMSRVMSYVLQSRVDVRDAVQITAWLGRFKELDSRLVHWKLLLPQKWRANPNMTRHVPLMDPNLTTAHLTHNATMILLHQIIAYAPPHWHFRSRLPVDCSVDACYLASVEIASIAEKYIHRSLAESPMSSACAFCLFIAARVLLIWWQSNGNNGLPSEFWSILRSLDEMSARWTGVAAAGLKQDIFARYATRLRQLHSLCVSNLSYRINVMYWASEANQDFSLSLALATQPTRSDSDNIPSAEPHAADFDAISGLMLDQDFADLDRIIAFDDGMMFAATLDTTSAMW